MFKALDEESNNNTIEDVDLPRSDAGIEDTNSVTSSLDEEHRRYEKLLLEKYKHLKMSTAAPEFELIYRSFSHPVLNCRESILSFWYDRRFTYK